MQNKLKFHSLLSQIGMASQQKNVLNTIGNLYSFFNPFQITSQIAKMGRRPSFVYNNGL